MKQCIDLQSVTVYFSHRKGGRDYSWRWKQMWLKQPLDGSWGDIFSSEQVHWPFSLNLTKVFALFRWLFFSFVKSVSLVLTARICNVESQRSTRLSSDAVFLDWLENGSSVIKQICLTRGVLVNILSSKTRALLLYTWWHKGHGFGQSWDVKPVKLYFSETCSWVSDVVLRSVSSDLSSAFLRFDSCRLNNKPLGQMDDFITW